MDVDEFVSSTRDDLAWGTVTPKKCRRHEWWMPPVVGPEAAGWDYGAHGWVCRKCRKPKDEAVSRRGKLNRSRGNAIEREVAKQLGLSRVGQYGGPDDAGKAGEPFIVQVKSGKSFPERIYRWLKALPSNANQTPLVVITDAPGPGHRRRALVVLTLEDWVALHGKLEEAA
jgi:hypothetical protein